MKDIIVGHLLYVPALIAIIAIGTLCWAVLRKTYAKRIYGGLFWNPAWIDAGALFGCIYATHELFIR